MKSKQYLVFGLGRFGMSVARSLCRLGQEVLAVDTREEPVDDIASDVTQVAQLDVTDENALKSLGVKNFDAAIVSIGQNTRDSILVCVLLKELGIPYLIAKANDDLHAKVLKKIGVDRVVFPEREMGARLARTIITPSVVDLADLSDDYQILETLLPKDWEGQTLRSLNVRKRYGMNVLAVRRGDSFIAAPGPDDPFQPGDKLLAIGRKTDIRSLEG